MHTISKVAQKILQVIIYMGLVILRFLHIGHPLNQHVFVMDDKRDRGEGGAGRGLERDETEETLAADSSGENSPKSHHKTSKELPRNDSNLKSGSSETLPKVGLPYNHGGGDNFAAAISRGRGRGHVLLQALNRQQTSKPAKTLPVRNIAIRDSEGKERNFLNEDGENSTENEERMAFQQRFAFGSTAQTPSTLMTRESFQDHIKGRDLTDKMDSMSGFPPLNFRAEDCSDDSSDSEDIMEYLQRKLANSSINNLSGKDSSAEIRTDFLDEYNQSISPSQEVFEDSTVESRTVVVHDIGDISKDMLEIYFENGRRSDGGEIEDITLSESGGENFATIVFKDPTVAARVLARTEPFVLREKILRVESPPKPLRTDPFSVLVQNVHPEWSVEVLELIFESKKRSGGGLIRDLNLNERSLTAVITFESEEVAQRVLAHSAERSLVHEGHSLAVHPYTVENQLNVLPQGNQDDPSDVSSPGDSRNEASSPEPEPCAILVRGIDNVGADILELYFESERKSGGGDIEEITLNDDHDGSRFATIIFRDPAVASRILARSESFVIDGKTLIVGPPPKPPKVDPSSIVVQNLDPNWSRDMLELLFESKKKSGGGDIQDIELYQTGADCGTAVIKFEEEDVAQRVLSRSREVSLCLEGRVLEVKPYECEEEEPEVVDGRVVIVEGVGPSTSTEVLSMYLESKKRSGGGDILEIEHEKGQSMAKVTFEEESAALNVLDKDGHSLEKCTLTVRRPTPDKKKPGFTGHHSGSAVLEASTNRPVASTSDDAINRVHTVMISGLKTLKEKDLRKFLENSPECGGPVRELQMYRDRNCAVVRFERNTDVRNLVERGVLSLRDSTLRVVPVDTSVQDDGDYEGPLAIAVRNLDPSTRRDLIELFFRNRRKSGGGDISNCYWDPDSGKAVITFTSATTVTNVYAKHEDETLSLNNCELDISKMTLTLPPRLVIGPKEPRILLIVEAPSLDRDELMAYILGAETTENPSLILSSILYSFSGKTIMLEFDEEPDFRQLGLLFATTPLKDHMMTLQRVAMATRIQVHDFSPSQDAEQMLELYFQDSSHGGRDDVEMETFDMDGKYAILDCSDTEVVNSITKKKHTVGDQRVSVSRYYPEFGILPPKYDASKPWTFLPPPYTHPLHPDAQNCEDIYEFITQSPAADSSQQLLGDVGHREKLFEINWEKSSASGLVICCHGNYEPKTKGEKWDDICKKEVNNILGNLAVARVPLLSEFFEKLKSEAVRKNQKQEVLLKFDEVQSVITMIGWCPEVKPIEKHVETVSSQLQEDMMRSQKSISETIQMEPYIVILIQTAKVTEQIRKQFPKLTIDFPSKNKMAFIGLPQEVKDAKVLTYEKVIMKTVSGRIEKVHAEKIELFRNKEVHEEAYKRFQKINISAVIDVTADTIRIHALNNGELKEARNIVEKMVLMQVMDIKPENLTVLRSEIWQKLEVNVTQKYTGFFQFTVDQSKLQIRITCVENVYDGLSEDMRNCLEENSVLEEFVELAPGCLRLMEMKQKSELDQITQQFKSCCVSINEVKDRERAGYVVKGTKFGLPQAVRKLCEIVSRVLERDQVFSQPGMPQYLRSQRGRDILDSTEMKLKVACEVVDPNQKSPSRMKKFSVDDNNGVKEIYQTSVAGGYTIRVLHGDITKLKVGAIVNAANCDLDHCGGLALAIVKAGGAVIQAESREHVAKNGKVRTGRVFLGRKTGKLQCDYIIHAVGPIYSAHGNNDNKANELYEAAFRSLEAAEGQNVKSIALPALSTGIFHFPLKEATGQICDAVWDFVQQNPSSVKEICLVDVLPKSVESFKESLEGLIKKGKLKVDTSEKNWSPPQKPKGLQFHLPPAQQHQGFSFPTVNQQPKVAPRLLHKRKTSTGQVKLQNGITVTVLISSIEKEQADVIVNTCNQQLDLSQGAVSAAILRAAGQGLQAECSQLAPVRMADIVRTSAGKIFGVQAIYHGACQQWDAGTGNSQQVLQQFIGNCLDAAAQDQCSSIAFPAVGTGNLNFPPDIVCQSMFDEFQKQQYAGSSVNDVRVVLYKKDSAVIQAFNNYVSSIAGGAPPVAPKPKPRQMVSESKTASASEHQNFIQHDDQNLMISAGSLTVLVSEGDITDESTEAIVNSTNSTLDFTQGAVTAAILKKGGLSIVNECQRLLAKTGGQIMGNALTDAGDLRCRKIVHMDAKTSDWEQTIRKTLKFSDGQGITSIAFPALGTGSLRLPAAKMAQTMLKAIGLFATQDNPQTLNTIHITIFDGSVFKAFKKEVENVMKNDQPGFWASAKALFKRVFVRGGSGHTESGAFSPYKPAKLDSVTIRIYSFSQKDTQDAITRLKKVCEDEVDEEILETAEQQELIKSLTSEQVVGIVSLEHDHNVKVEVDKGRRINRICVSGRTKDVASCTRKIQTILNDVKNEKERVKQAEHMMKLVQWQYKHQGQSFVDYDRDINYRIETAYAQAEPSASWQERDGDYEVFFSSMVEKQKNKLLNVEIRRTLLSSGGGKIDLPSKWAPMQSGAYYQLEQLSTSDKEYTQVEAGFRKCCPNNNIVKIERVQNPSLYKQYLVKKEHLEEVNPKHHTKETKLYHGTAGDAVPSINTSGFNRSYCGKNAVAIGNGVYFAVDARYSASHKYSPPDMNGHRHIYQCLVLTGEYTRGSGGLKVPPQRVPNVNYDSVVDNVQSPSMYVIFNDTQAYPEYLITFQ